MTRRIVVGLDGSEGAARALDWSIEYARGRQDLVVLVVHALSPTMELTMALPPFDYDQWRKDTQDELERWCEPLREAGVHYQARLVDDYPARALAMVAEDRSAELVVVGLHGHGRIMDHLPGGVAIKLIQHATTPVVVVPPPGLRHPADPALDLSRPSR